MTYPPTRYKIGSTKYFSNKHETCGAICGVVTSMSIPSKVESKGGLKIMGLTSS